METFPPTQRDRPNNRQIMHNYTVKGLAQGPYMEDGVTARPHVPAGAGGEVDCWCAPRVLEWRQGPSGRMRWVDVTPERPKPAGYR